MIIKRITLDIDPDHRNLKIFRLNPPDETHGKCLHIKTGGIKLLYS